MKRFLALLVSTLALLPMNMMAAPPTNDLRIVMVDVDGGAAVLFLTPEGKSLLIDTGWPPGPRGPRPAPGATPPPPSPSSADRIAAAATSLGITKIDYLVMTHYHFDHIGGLNALLAKIPVGTFIDHGPNTETYPADVEPGKKPADPALHYPDWVKAYAGHEHISATVGQKLDIGSMRVEFVTSDGKSPATPLPGAGQPNPACANVPGMTEDGGEENNRSLGMLITFGKTRVLELGDLTWNKEIELLCPVNKIGKVDVYFVTGHGMNISSSPPTAALSPVVALMQNGRNKGGDQEVLKTVKSYPSLEGLWLDHYSVRYPDLNGDPNYIANLASPTDEGYAVDVSITPQGEITVTNERNHFSKTYKAHAAK